MDEIKISAILLFVDLVLFHGYSTLMLIFFPQWGQVMAWESFLNIQKVDSSIREAYGTLNEKLMPAVTGTDKRAKNDTVQVYFDTERQEYRCFKRTNLLRIA